MCWSQNKLYTVVPSWVGDFITFAVEMHHPIRKQMIRLIFKGQFVVRFLNPPIKYQLGEAAPLVKANGDIVALCALQ